MVVSDVLVSIDRLISDINIGFDSEALSGVEVRIKQKYQTRFLIRSM